MKKKFILLKDSLIYFLLAWISWIKSVTCFTSSTICPHFITNGHGHLDSHCRQEKGSNCTYVCDSGCNSSGGEPYCMDGEIWSRGNCTCYNSPVYQSKLSVLDIVGIIVGVLIFILCVSICVTIWMKRRRRSVFLGRQHTSINRITSSEELSANYASATATVSTISSTVMHYANVNYPPPPYNEIQITPELSPPAYEEIIANPSVYNC